MEKVHKTIIFIILSASLFWSLLSYGVNPIELLFPVQPKELLILMYTVGYTVVFWPIFYVEVFDIICSSLGKNGEIYKEFSHSLKEDLILTTSGCFLLSLIYLLDSSKYSFNSIDIGAVGISFSLAAIYKVIQIYKTIKVLNNSQKIVTTLVSLAIAINLTILISSLTRISSGEYQAYQSIWFQITMIFSSFYLYTNTSLYLFCIKRGEFEISKTKIFFLDKVLMKQLGSDEN